MGDILIGGIRLEWGFGIFQHVDIKYIGKVSSVWNGGVGRIYSEGVTESQKFVPASRGISAKRIVCNGFASGHPDAIFVLFKNADGIGTWWHVRRRS